MPRAASNAIMFSLLGTTFCVQKATGSVRLSSMQATVDVPPAPVPTIVFPPVPPDPPEPAPPRPPDPPAAVDVVAVVSGLVTQAQKAAAASGQRAGRRKRAMRMRASYDAARAEAHAI